MDKDRIAGAAKQAKGVVKEVPGKALGDNKLGGDGKSDKAESKIQSAVRRAQEVGRRDTPGQRGRL